jgi:hypothetical protein
MVSMKRPIEWARVRRVSGGTAAVIIGILAVAGCTVAGPSLSPASTSPVTATLSPAQTAFAAPASLPAGPWRSIHWTKVAARAPTADPIPVQTDSEVMVLSRGPDFYAWSGGFVSIKTLAVWNQDRSWTFSMAIEASVDGVTWVPGKGLALSGDTLSVDTISGTAPLGVDGLLEGPAGLMAYWLAKVTCSDPWIFAYPLALSPDGLDWRVVDRTGWGSIQTLDGGSAGYIATGEAGVFTSTNGTSWLKADLRGEAFKSLDGVNGGTAFADGYVIAGNTFGPETEGCASGPTLLTPSLWYSPDGRTWTRDEVPGVVAGSGTTMDVSRLTDHLLSAQEWHSNLASPVWISTDGRTWKEATVPKGRWLVNGTHALLSVIPNLDNPAIHLYSIDDNLTTTELEQTGDVPAADVAHGPMLGPVDLVAVDEGGNVYVGVPVAG